MNSGHLAETRNPINVVEAALKYVGNIGSVGAEVSALGLTGEYRANGTDDPATAPENVKSQGVGAKLAYQGANWPGRTPTMAKRTSQKPLRRPATMPAAGGSGRRKIMRPTFSWPVPRSVSDISRRSAFPTTAADNPRPLVRSGPLKPGPVL